MARLVVEVVGDTRQLEKSFGRVQKKSSALGKGLKFGAVAGIGALAGVAKIGFDELSDMQRQSAQTAAALKSTGGVANVTAKQVDRLANSILKQSGIDDEAVKASENMLLTFTNVRNEVGKGNKIFDQATQAIADVATRMNNGLTPNAEQLSKTSIQLGKALNDPVKGIGSLRRIGVTFTADQKKLIASLVKTGDTAGAQKVILAELRKEFGGSAKAAGQTLPGKLNILKETLKNVTGEIALKLAPTITRLIDRMTKWLENTQNQKRIMDTLTTTVKVATTVLKTLKGAFDVLSKVVGGNKRAIELLVAAYATWKIAKIAGNVADLASKFIPLGKNAKGATAGVKGLSGSFAGKLGLAAAVVAAGYELSTFIRKIPGWDKKMKAFGGSVKGVTDKLGITKDPTKQFQGKTILSPAASSFIRNQAARLEAGGLTPSQAAARIGQSHPDVAARDIQVLAGVFGNRPTVVNVQIDGKTVATATARHSETAAAKRARSRPAVRRGT